MTPCTAERLGHGERGDEDRRHRNEDRRENRVLLASTVLVSQAYEAHDDQSAARISIPWPSPAQL